MCLVFGGDFGVGGLDDGCGFVVGDGMGYGGMGGGEYSDGGMFYEIRVVVLWIVSEKGGRKVEGGGESVDLLVG